MRLLGWDYNASGCMYMCQQYNRLSSSSSVTTSRDNHDQDPGPCQYFNLTDRRSCCLFPRTLYGSIAGSDDEAERPIKVWNCGFGWYCREGHSAGTSISSDIYPFWSWWYPCKINYSNAPASIPGKTVRIVRQGVSLSKIRSSKGTWKSYRTIHKSFSGFLHVLLS